MNVIDFSTLPTPTVVEVLDFENVRAEMLVDLVSRDPAFSALVESDPAIKIIEVCAYRETLLRARINDAARAVLLAHATGADLDNLAALFAVSRKIITPADPTTIPPTPPVLEPDADLRRRVLLSLDGLATAGARNAYIFHALSVAGVRDANVMSAPDYPPGEVHVFVLGDADSGIPDALTLQRVTAALNAATVRPLTDSVFVAPGEVRPYALAASIYTYPGPDSDVVLANARVGAERYTTDNFRLGRDITLSGLYAALHVPGVQRVELSSPTATIVNTPAQCSRCTGITLAIAGTDE